LCIHHVNIYELRFYVKNREKKEEIALYRDIGNKTGHVSINVKLRRVRATIVAVEK
jgi:hypothetical protein